ncbi:hypothetical protein A3H16_01495 [Candidatus Kaiserbacteria bacterium RIFCSPLOWO2_12_FULL_53_8]|uniref:Antitoxin n=2 Tax=Candidatus Kaiseribacteriota TaxID=1752734 RepID=A0A1F6CW49_9BACT|nr:MAG: hypothetical protein A2851_00220 [Candidatus Kaiserbacteria bacterium RIFCSPHIGHO2_01_FULL_53_29]OGG91084.1 MAG: hypothetical protein A3H16_01495 [Candidatus Kaiserbacteria bacterium RIFCSPLOWO2_12_FULL_53_8]
MTKTKQDRLTKEERMWEKWILSGKAKSIPDLARAKKSLAAAARRTRLERTKLVSIRVREYDLARLRARSEREGLPYQTLINSLIHKYAEGEYKR